MSGSWSLLTNFRFLSSQPKWAKVLSMVYLRFSLIFSLSNIILLNSSFMFTKLSIKAKYLMIMMLTIFFCRGPSTLSRLLCFVSQGLCACMHWESRSNYQYWAWCCWETSLFHAVRNQIGKNNFMAFKEAFVTGEMYCDILLNTHLSHLWL